MTDREDETIRSALGELRARDERVAPRFEDVIVRRTATYTIGGWPALALAAGLVLAIGITYGVVTRAPRLDVPKEVIALSTWRPASDALLDTSARHLLTHAPQLGASLIDVGKPSGELR